jgi:hypothetical protein
VVEHAAIVEVDRFTGVRVHEIGSHLGDVAVRAGLGDVGLNAVGEEVGDPGATAVLGDDVVELAGAVGVGGG